jgi:hypothetical protein
MPKFWSKTPAEIGAELVRAFPNQFARFVYNKQAPVDAYVRGAGVKVNWGRGGAPPSAPKTTQFMQEMFDDYCRIAALLTDRDRCLVHLKKLDLEVAEELALALYRTGHYNPTVPWEVALIAVKKYGQGWVSPDMKMKKVEFQESFDRYFPDSVRHRHPNVTNATTGLSTNEAANLSLNEAELIEAMLPLMASIAGSGTTPKFHGVLQKVLLRKENQHGFNGMDGTTLPPELVGTAERGKTPTLTGFYHPESFLKHLIAQGYHFKDPGAGIAHGEFTHRIQWWIVISEYESKGPYAIKGRPLDRMRHCALLMSHAWQNAGVGYEIPANTSQDIPHGTGRQQAEALRFGAKGMWDFCFDCLKEWSDGNPNPVDLTYRSPEALLTFLKGSLAPQIPVLSNFLKVRNNKRGFFELRGLQGVHPERVLKSLEAKGVQRSDLPGKLAFPADGKAVWL